MKENMIRIAIGILFFALGAVYAEADGYYSNLNSQWEVAREDFGHACIEYTKGGTRITEFVLVWEREKGSETCHGELIDARKRWEVKNDPK
jgi:hypothetical protein